MIQLIQESENQDIQLVFPRKRNGYSDAGGIDKDFFVKIEKIEEWFKNYKIESIELYIEGIAKSGEIINLFVSAEGKAGCKVTLKPK